MNRKQILIGETYWFYSEKNGEKVLKKAVAVGPWNREYPEYLGIKDVTSGGFCYIEASRLHRSSEELTAKEDGVYNRLRLLSQVTPVEDTSRGILRASLMKPERGKIRIV